MQPRGTYYKNPSFLPKTIFEVKSYSKRAQYNFLIFSMENWLQPQTFPQPSFYSISEEPYTASSSFSHFLYPQPFISQIMNRITIMQQSLGILTNQLNQLKCKQESATITNISGHCQEQCKKTNTNTLGQSKQFPKHLKCPVLGCKRRYSSKIAVRAHLRKCHKQQVQI